MLSTELQSASDRFGQSIAAFPWRAELCCSSLSAPETGWSVTAHLWRRTPFASKSSSALDCHTAPCWTGLWRTAFRTLCGPSRLSLVSFQSAPALAFKSKQVSGSIQFWPFGFFLWCFAAECRSSIRATWLANCSMQGLCRAPLWDLRCHLWWFLVRSACRLFAC